MNTYTIKQIQFFEKNVRTNTFSTNKCAFLKRFKWRFKLFILNLGAGGGLITEKCVPGGHRSPTGRFACGARSMGGRTEARGRE